MIATAEQVAAALSIPFDASDTKLERVVRAADTLAKRFCARPFELGTYVEWLTGYGDNRTWTTEEIQSVVSLKLYFMEGYRLTSSFVTYDLGALDFSKQELILRDGWAFPQTMKAAQIEYVGGYYAYDDADPMHEPKMPADLFDAVVRMAAQMYERGTDEQFSSETMGMYSYSRAAASFGFDPTVESILSSYKRMYV